MTYVEVEIQENISPFESYICESKGSKDCGEIAKKLIKKLYPEATNITDCSFFAHGTLCIYRFNDRFTFVKL